MFLNMGTGELMVILVIALVVIPPEKLPAAARRAGELLAQFRRISAGFQQEFQDAVDAAMRSAPAPDEAARRGSTRSSADAEPTRDWSLPPLDLDPTDALAPSSLASSGAFPTTASPGPAGPSASTETPASAGPQGAAADTGTGTGTGDQDPSTGSSPGSSAATGSSPSLDIAGPADSFA